MSSLSKFTFMQPAYQERHFLQLHFPGGRPKRRAPVKKSRTRRFIFNTCSHMHGADESGELGLGTPEPERASDELGEIARVEMLNIESSFDTEQRANSNSPSSDYGAVPSEQSKTSEKYLFDDNQKQVIMIDGNRAFMVTAKPWPTQVRESALDAYKYPNPKLTKNELKDQTERVAERRATVAALNNEKITRRDRMYSNGFYFLPKSLLNESKARLAIWYKAKAEPPDGVEEITKNAELVWGK